MHDCDLADGPHCYVCDSARSVVLQTVASILSSVTNMNRTNAIALKSTIPSPATAQIVSFIVHVYNGVQYKELDEADLEGDL